MTLNELTTDIAGRYGRELDLQYRQWLVPKINTWRSRLIRNSLEKHPNEKSQFLQPINIPLEYGNYTCAPFSCNGSYSGDIPKLLRVGDTPFEYLGSVDTTSPYRYTDMGTQAWINKGMTAHLFINYLFDGSRVIIPNHRIAQVMGLGIFDEPEKVFEWQCKNIGEGCDWWNQPYPITGDIAAMAKTAIWNELNPKGDQLPDKSDQDE